MADVSEILTELKNHLIENYGSSVQDVILFGSRARGDASEYSDFDVLIVLKRKYSPKDEDRILDLCYDIDLKYNILIDVHIMSEREKNSIRGRQPVFKNAIKSGIYAWLLKKKIE